MAVGLIGAPSGADVNYTPAYTGLSTVAYKLVAADKSTLQDWTTSGVTELETGSGLYGVAWSSTFFGTTLGITQVQGAKIRWRTAAGVNITEEDLYICYPAPSAADYTTARAAKLDKIVGDTPVIRDAE